ncbi:Armadillo repeat-containing protein 6 [Dissostichus eleginoides]|uniref:Armadillo repeat-containing protein 6 n=1 Tax=Dissostichus eleginoides TaxID=100907 RepID=A0AAD9EVH6_DISEL|nr:Armadillo repeat-containing protein 6 [Dissostichus eleginoides]
MAKRMITQETFDAAVRENMEEFEMDPDEALKDAVEQFESQGVNLNCIIQAVPPVSSDGKQEPTHEVLKVLNSLCIVKDSASVQDVEADLKRFTELCSLELAQRYLAAQKDAYPVILSYCKKGVEEQEAVCTALSALAALTNGQPDLLNAEGQQFLLNILKKYKAESSNRQDLVKAGILPLLTGAIKQHGESAQIVKEATAALKVMTFDDDVRVAFGQAHEHAKMIVLENNGLKVLIGAAKAHLDNTSVLSELCATLSHLAVRNEFCQDICDLGGLKLIMTLLAEGYEKAELIRQLIVIAMNRHMNNSAVCEQGCACLSVLALRKPENCIVIMENGGALAAVQAMRTHTNSINVQKQACMLMRNLVGRLSNLSQPILDLGAEELINQYLKTHQDCGDVGKAALRDLGCHVELRELWTGKHGSLTQ